jgi:hypothetical protein
LAQVKPQTRPNASSKAGAIFLILSTMSFNQNPAGPALIISHGVYIPAAGPQRMPPFNRFISIPEETLPEFGE